MRLFVSQNQQRVARYGRWAPSVKRTIALTQFMTPFGSVPNPFRAPSRPRPFELLPHRAHDGDSMMNTRNYSGPGRPGRPAVPMEGRGHRPYDPCWGTPKRRMIVRALYRHRKALDSGAMTHCDLARMIGTSISYLSITKNSLWGQRELGRLAWADASADRPEGEQC